MITFSRLAVHLEMTELKQNREQELGKSRFHLIPNIFPFLVAATGHTFTSSLCGVVDMPEEWGAILERLRDLLRFSSEHR